MMRRPILAAAWLIAHAAVAHADPGDLPIPEVAAPQPPASGFSMTSHDYVQGDVTISGERGALSVPLPPPAPPTWEARLFLDTRVNGTITDDVSFAYSGRLNLRGENGPGFHASDAIRSDLREAYLAWQGGSGLFVELGRINLKTGVAEGFNPTDYFKTRAVVEPVSSDPTVLREDRLGTAMVLGQAIWPTGSVTVVFAPKFAHDSPPYLDTNLPQFDPSFDRTNAHERALIKASFQLFDDVSPEVLAYDESGHVRLGLNLTRGFGRATIAYLEWSGGRRASLADDAFQDGVRNQVLQLTPPIPLNGKQGFANDLAIGAGYTTKNGVHFDLEYDLHQAGFSAADWRHWFDGAKGAGPLETGALWFIRSYAADQQEPLARSSLFLRASWSNAFIRNLTVAAFADATLRDGSIAGQVAADYNISSAWTFGGLVGLYCGAPRSNFGSLPQSVNMLVKLTRYF